MEGDLIFFTTEEMVKEQESNKNDEGSLEFKLKDPASNKIIEAKVDVASLRQTMSQVCEAMNSDEINTGSFIIDEIEVALGINGSGKVGILGTGAEVGAQASIKVLIKRNKDNNANSQ